MSDLIYAIGLLLQQTDATTFQLMTEPVKMVMEECIAMAAQLNMDNSHPFILTCTPFVEATTEVVQ